MWEVRRMREKQVMVEAEEEMTRMRDAMEAKQFEDKSATLLKSEGIIITFLFDVWVYLKVYI